MDKKKKIFHHKCIFTCFVSLEEEKKKAVHEFHPEYDWFLIYESVYK